MSESAPEAGQNRNAALERQDRDTKHAGGQTWLVTPDLLAVLTVDGFFADVNPAWTTMLGWSSEEMMSRPFTSFVHPDDVVASMAAHRSVRQGDPVFRFENRYLCKDGGARWLSWSATAEGEHIYCSARDITLDKAAAQERDRLWALSEDMLARADYSGRMSAVNPAWSSVLGYTEQQLLTRPYADIIHPDDIGVTVAALTSMGETGQPTRFENRILASNGEWKPIGWTVSPEPDSVHFIAVGRHLAEYKAREKELMQAQEQLRQSQKMEAVGQLTGGLAHDFNNLLTGISGSLELLQLKVAQGRVGEIDRYVQAAMAASRRAAALTHRLLAFSRRQTLDPRVIDMNRLVAGMEELVRRTVGPEIAVERIGADDLWNTIVDPGQLENALLNLCINARDAMPGGGKLTINTANRWLDHRAANERDLKAGQYVTLCVSDTGTGMTPDIIAKAFDPFFTTKPIGMGTGLGLSMIYGFVRQSGGQVRIDSTPGSGTTVCLYLPRHAGHTEEPDGAPDLAEAPRANRNETVLVVDDEPTVRMLVGDVLEDLGYAALEAADGPSGLAIINSNARIDLMVTDVAERNERQATGRCGAGRAT